MNTATAITLAALASLTPTVTCLIGIVLSRQDSRDLRSEFRDLRSEFRDLRSEFRDLRSDVSDLRTEMHSGFARVDEHLQQFYAITGKLEGRVDEISKR